MSLRQEQIHLEPTVTFEIGEPAGGTTASSDSSRGVQNSRLSSISRHMRCAEIMAFIRSTNFGCCCCAPKHSAIIIGIIHLIASLIITALLCGELVALESIEKLPNIAAVRPQVFTLMVFTGVLLFLSIGGSWLSVGLLYGVFSRRMSLIFLWVVGVAASVLIQVVVTLVELYGLDQPYHVYKFITFPFDIYFIMVVHNYFRELCRYEEHQPLSQTANVPRASN